MENFIKKNGIQASSLSKARMASRQNNKSILENLSNDEELGKNGIDKIIFIEELSRSKGVILINSTKDIELDTYDAQRIKYTELERRNCIPIIIDGNKYVGFNSFFIENVEYIQYIKNILGNKIVLAILTSEVYTKLHSTLIMPNLIQSIAEDKLSNKDQFEEVVDLSSTESGLEQVVYMIIESAIKQRASDIHFLPSNSQVIISYRIDGVKKEIQRLSVDINRISRKICVMASISETGKDEVKKGKVVVMLGKRKVELRVNIIPSKAGPDINLRLLSDSAIDLRELGISERLLKDFDRGLKMSKGLILLVGPMGSGKSTTLYGAIKRLKENGRDICAIEDPVEIKMDGITQVDVMEKLPYKLGIEAFMRHNANVIMVGEIRELSTATAAFTAASTGALTLSTLHSNSALLALYRLINMGVSTDQITESLVLIVAQGLVRRVCPDCKEEYLLPEDHVWREEFNLPSGEIKLARGSCCVSCNYTGYYGRVVVQESIFITKAIRECIDNSGSRSALERLVISENLKTMWDDAKEKALAGITTMEEISPMFYDLI